MKNKFVVGYNVIEYGFNDYFDLKEKIYKIKLADKKICCEGMVEEWEEHIGFEGGSDDIIYQEMGIVFYSYIYGNDDKVNIKYCPFCGAKIELVERKRKVLRKRNVTIPEKTIEETYIEDKEG